MLNGIQEVHALVRGKVQGVGFRYTAQNLAREMHLKGTVRNLPDRSVEIYVQGPQIQIEAFLKKLENEIFADEIEQITKKFIAPQSYEGFQILS